MNVELATKAVVIWEETVGIGLPNYGFAQDPCMGMQAVFEKKGVNIFQS